MFVTLLNIHSASLSQHTFAVARVREGWMLWAWIHYPNAPSDRNAVLVARGASVLFEKLAP